MSTPNYTHNADVDSLVRCLEEGAAMVGLSLPDEPAALTQQELNHWIVHTLSQMADQLGLQAQQLAELSNRQACETTMLWKLKAEMSQAQTADSTCEEAGPNSIDSALSESEYVAFEQLFRGSEKTIKKRQRAYGKMFAGRRRVLDLGCGRGEFLELGSDYNFTPTGVDFNQHMVEACTRKGLKACRADIFEHLKTVEDSSLDGIFSAQLIEHVPPQAISKLISLCQQKLAPGGLLVLETVNPACAKAMGEFYLDPTHVRPVPARMVGFLMQRAGLELLKFRFSAPTSDKRKELLEFTTGWPDEVSYYQDYAAVATKPSS